MANDASVFLSHPWEEPWDVFQYHQGDIEGVTEAHESGALVRGIDIQNTGQYCGLVADDSNWMSIEASETGQNIPSEPSVDLQELALIKDAFDDIMHVVRAIGVIWYDLQ